MPLSVRFLAFEWRSPLMEVFYRVARMVTEKLLLTVSFMVCRLAGCFCNNPAAPFVGGIAQFYPNFFRVHIGHPVIEFHVPLKLMCSDPAQFSLQSYQIASCIQCRLLIKSYDAMSPSLFRLLSLPNRWQVDISN